MQLRKTWRVTPPAPRAAGDLAARLGLTPVVAQLLLNRGLDRDDDIRAFLHPDLNHLHDPALLPQLDRAAERLRQAVERREPVVIYGDYDVDGISAITILTRCLSLLNADAEFYVPDRVEEGYGLNADAVTKLADRGTRLLITVDCGITAVAEIALARRLGMDVIVTDHHEPADQVPADALLVNPKLTGSPYPFRELSGAGLAFKLAWAVGKTLSAGRRVSPEFRDFLLDAVSLAALGTVADVVPLRGENRTLAHFGLKGLAASDAPGIKALRLAAGIDGQQITAYDVAFKLAPRLNAAGRLGSARLAVELLTTTSPDRAREIAEHLNRENTRRQRLQQTILDAARDIIETAGGLADRAAIVLAHEDWHPGVIGIVASRLVAEFHRPTILLTLDHDTAHGSARSIPGLDLLETIRDCAPLLTGFGGHAQAAGLRLKREHLAAFQQAFEHAAADRLSEDDLVPVIDIDAEIELGRITRRFLDELRPFAPFGEGNAEPVFAAGRLDVSSGIRRMGSDGRHLSFWVNKDGAGFRAVAFGMGHLAQQLSRHRPCSLAFVPRLNRWRGSENIELEIRDIRFENPD